ncbi:Uncharacterized protein APZ42_026761 [Daphnia magna]|uniref:Uncharacterized protein n=1 Tax=Daphnia magna TaxID=35525 RepID=A0A164RWF5_9CRUS|nr:Uncharacterized protein APZ42_026761 [Daphnia magna]
MVLHMKLPKMKSRSSCPMSVKGMQKTPRSKSAIACLIIEKKWKELDVAFAIYLFFIGREWGNMFAPSCLQIIPQMPCHVTNIDFSIEPICSNSLDYFFRYGRRTFECENVLT